MNACLEDKIGFGEGCGSERQCLNVFNSGVPLRLLGQPVLSELSSLMVMYLFIFVLHCFDLIVLIWGMGVLQ